MPDYSSNKRFEAVGLASRKMVSKEDAMEMTYRTRDGKCPPTPLVFPDNPFNEDILKARTVLDVGCGIGRNLPWIMENTEADYFGLDPNTTMLHYFHQVQGNDWYDRIFLYADLTKLPQGVVFDVVLSTFTLQHIHYDVKPDQMDASDIGLEIKKHTKPGTIWFLLEHEWEQPGWQKQWLTDMEFMPDVKIINWNDPATKVCPFPELSHRGTHNLIIIKEREGAECLNG
jgi:SAM-dependent methyltransferase